MTRELIFALQIGHFSSTLSAFRRGVIRQLVGYKHLASSVRVHLDRCIMACDDDYVVDAGGNRILIGLTADETREFERLDDLISELGPAATDDIQSLNERRWLILYDKHQSSVKIFISIQNAMAFRKSRTAQAS